MPSTGRATAAMARTRTAAPARSPAARLSAEQRLLLRTLAQAVARSRGRASTIMTRLNSSSGTVTSTQSVTTARAQGLSTWPRGPPAPGQQAQQGRLDALEQVRYAGGVGQDVVPVEPHQREQLPDHLQDLGDHHQQQGVEAGGPPDAHDGHRHDGVEVQAAEVRAEPAAAAQPVGIGDVGEERRPDQVQACAHGAGRGAAFACRGSVAELVEAGGQHGDGEDQQQQGRVGKGLMGGGARPFTISTHQQAARKAAITATTISGLNRTAKGAVSLRVRSGSVTV